MLSVTGVGYGPTGMLFVQFAIGLLVGRLAVAALMMPRFFEGRLGSAYQMLVQETPMCGAELQIGREPLRSRCDLCGEEFVVERFRFECPKCHNRDVTIVSGETLVLESVTLQHEEPSFHQRAP